MATAAPTRPVQPTPPPPSARPRSLRALRLSLAGATLIALALFGVSHALAPLSTVVLGALASLVLFSICGAALALRLVPVSWGPLALLIALPIGAATSGLVLTALGIAGVPLHVSLWLVLACGLAACALVIRHRPRAVALDRRSDRHLLMGWVAVLLALFCVAMIPAWRTGQTTIYGENPDAHQVVGIAVLFQHVRPTGTDVSLPIDTVPRFWRFRYPIFYPLAAVSNLAHMDPIRAFPAIAALLVVILALGFGALAVRCLRAPPAAGPVVAAAVGLSVVTLHLAWHPYWNQLWGLAMMPYALLFGWCALETLDVRLGALFALVVVMLALAYPLALPDPLVILAALAIGYGRRPRPLKALRSRSWVFGLIALLILAPAVAGAAIKLYQGVSQLFSPHGALWGGDVPTLLPVGRFVGTGGGIVPALAVAAVAALGLRALPRRVGLAFGLALLALCLVDVRFRAASTGAYMDFKQLSFVGAIVVAVAAATVTGWLFSRRLAAPAAGVLLALVWAAAAAVQDQQEIVQTTTQVTPQMFQLRSWAQRLPRGASVRVDIPPSGVQLWAVYMLGAHPVDSIEPIVNTTYAHAPYGWRAEYSLSLHYRPIRAKRVRAYPPPPFAVNPPVFADGQFALRKLVWPKRFASYPRTASRTLVEP